MNKLLYYEDQSEAVKIIIDSLPIQVIAKILRSDPMLFNCSIKISKQIRIESGTSILENEAKKPFYYKEIVNVQTRKSVMAMPKRLSFAMVDFHLGRQQYRGFSKLRSYLTFSVFLNSGGFDIHIKNMAVHGNGQYIVDFFTEFNALSKRTICVDADKNYAKKELVREYNWSHNTYKNALKSEYPHTNAFLNVCFLDLTYNSGRSFIPYSQSTRSLGLKYDSFRDLHLAHLERLKNDVVALTGAKESEIYPGRLYF